MIAVMLVGVAGHLLVQLNLWCGMTLLQVTEPLSYCAMMAVIGLPVLLLPFLLLLHRDWRMAQFDGKVFCRRCGYHLRGLPTTRCPECGTDNPGAKESFGMGL